MALFEIKPVDRAFYEKQLADFLPPRMIDIHTHVWLSRFNAPVRGPVRAVTWPKRVAADNSIEDLEETYRLFFPGKAVTPLIFGSTLSPDDDIAGGNRYVSEAARAKGFPGLIFSVPSWTAAEFEDRLLAGGFSGAKSYLTLSPSYLPEKEIRIYDFFPSHHLDVLDRHGLIAMVHIPRDGRARDPVNLAQIKEIDARYSRLQVIIAHAGRAYCPEDVGHAFEVLAGTRVWVDISANTNEEVFTQLIRAVGPRRILFGSDLPILRMRMRRICENGRYVNLVPKGLYGDVSGDRNMREVEGAEAERLTFFMYEELAAFRRAAEATELSRVDIENVFYHNAIRLLKTAGWTGN